MEFEKIKILNVIIIFISYLKIDNIKMVPFHVYYNQNKFKIINNLSA